MPLTDRALRATKPLGRPYKVTDGGGLHLLVTPAGGRLWRFKYRFAGREKLLALGAYLAIGIRDARDAWDDAKAMLRSGSDPGAMRKAGRAPCSRRSRIA